MDHMDSRIGGFHNELLYQDYGMAYEYFNTLCDTFYMDGKHFTDSKGFWIVGLITNANLLLTKIRITPAYISFPVINTILAGA